MEDEVNLRRLVMKKAAAGKNLFISQIDLIVEKLCLNFFVFEKINSLLQIFLILVLLPICKNILIKYEENQMIQWLARYLGYANLNTSYHFYI